jgi:Fe-S-cluster containining protein
MNSIFPCNKCGECCRNITGVKELEAFDDGNGVCVHLNENVCSIYDSRPDVCRVDVMYDNFFSQKFSEVDYININKAACIALQEKAMLSIKIKGKP